MSTQSMPTLFGRGTVVFKEHEDLRPLVTRLREYGLVLALGRDRGVSESETLLERFFDQLLIHFAAEEDEGYFGTFVEESPELSVDVERLMVDHEEMVDAIEQLRVLWEAEAGERDLGLRLLALLDKFETHEREENLLMRRFLSSAPPAPKPESA